MLLEIIELNQHVIKLQKGQQPPYRPIYSLGPVEHKTLKTYFKTNLANGFIWLLKSLVSTQILFVRRPNDSFYLYVNYQDLNNLIIKNWYSLPLIGKSFDQLDRAKRFTQLDLTNVYY